ncbi:SDR family oxidoreductase [Flagellimonas marinaquae]|uniref:SDR family oxidoreductase n=1 Tax=Flagellimonas marinaquae TaxID=254955 RepID=UPI0028BD50AF|nr:SDR family oxidoreductase [Allomuricauda aquimarina]
MLVGLFPILGKYGGGLNAPTTQPNAKKNGNKDVAPKDVRSNMEEQVPVKRIGDPKEYGYLVTFLASEQAAFITGTNIPIDGGLLRSL